MNLPKAIHVNVALAGLGMTLFFASPARAQQETNPDHFDQSTVESYHESAQPVAARSNQSKSAKLNGKSAKALAPAGNRQRLATDGKNPARLVKDGEKQGQTNGEPIVRNEMPTGRDLLARKRVS